MLLRFMESCKSLNEKGSTKRESYPLRIRRVIRKKFIARILRIFNRGNCRFKV